MILMKSGVTTDAVSFDLCSCHCEAGEPPYTGHYYADDYGFEMGGCGCDCSPALSAIAVHWAARMP